MIMLCANDSKTKGQQSACGSKEIGPPFPFPLWGKPGREGSPHAAEDGCSPHKRAAPPCESPALFAQGIDRTGLLMEGTVTGPEGWSWMKAQKAQKKRSSTKTRFRPGRTGACEAQLWTFTSSPGILKDDHAPEVHWVAAESLDAALLYLRRRHDDFMITEVRFLGMIPLLSGSPLD